MADKQNLDGRELDRLLALARDLAPEPSMTLTRQVAATARQLQPAAALPPARGGLWQQVLDWTGGWPGLGGLAAAGVVGFAFGIGGLLDMASANEGPAPALSLLPGGTTAGDALLGAGDE